MLRRKFLQSLGAAILGTAIALKVPDILMPAISLKTEIYPQIIDELFFQVDKHFAYFRAKLDKDLYG